MNVLHAVDDAPGQQQDEDRADRNRERAATDQEDWQESDQGIGV